MILKEEQFVYENRMPGRIFQCKREEAVGGWLRLHDEELCNLYFHQILLG
jgi:hypothetical protein